MISGVGPSDAMWRSGHAWDVAVGFLLAVPGWVCARCGQPGGDASGDRGFAACNADFALNHPRKKASDRHIMFGTMRGVP